MDENHSTDTLLLPDPDEITGVYRRPPDDTELPPRKFARGTTNPPARPPDMVVMTQDEFEAHTLKWYRIGISATGEGFHGEKMLADPGAWSLFKAYFCRLWGQRDKEEV
jgi:hypothetical protein